HSVAFSSLRELRNSLISVFTTNRRSARSIQPSALQYRRTALRCSRVVLPLRNQIGQTSAKTSGDRWSLNHSGGTRWSLNDLNRGCYSLNRCDNLRGSNNWRSYHRGPI